MRLQIKTTLALLLLIAACGGGGRNPNPGDGGNLSGTINAPQGGDVQGTLVAACFLADNRCDLNSSNTKVVQINASGASAAINFTGLSAGNYVVLAQKDVNGNRQLDAGDYSGCYGNAQGCLAVRPPMSGLTVQLAVVGDSGAAEGSISGTLFFPGDIPQPTGSALSIEDGKDKLNAVRPLEVVRGEWIVSFKQGVSIQSTQRLTVSGLNAERVRGVAGLNLSLYRASGLDQEATIAFAAQLQTHPDVESVTPNYILHTLKTPNDPFYGAQWHYPLMNLPNAWDIADGTAAPVTVGVVDTGILANHPDLQNRLLPGYDFVSDVNNAGDGNGRDANPEDMGGDTNYHGSHVAGTVVAATNNSLGVAGVSWGAKVVPVRALGVKGGGTLADILDGVAWAAGRTVQGVANNPNPAKVVNLSLGSRRSCSSAEAQLFSSLAASGVIVVVAAGNSNADAVEFAPASCDNVITVGAVGPQGARAPYSNYGATIDVMAPGGDTTQKITFNGREYVAGVLSTSKQTNGSFGYSFLQGTSMASPHVAGLVALMASRDASLDLSSALARLKSSAKPLSDQQCKRPTAADCGAGLVDAARALSASGGGGTPPPAPPPPPTGQVKTYVVGFYCSNFVDCLPADLERSKVIEVQVTSTRFPFSLTGLRPGPYLVAAWSDTNGDEKVTDGEPFGVASRSDGSLNIVNLQAGQRLIGLSVRMEAAETSKANFAEQATLRARIETLVSQRVNLEGLTLFR